MLPSKYVRFLKSPWKESFFMIARTVKSAGSVIAWHRNEYYFWTEISDLVVDEGKWDVCLTLILESWAADFSAENGSKRRVLIYPAYFYIIKWATELQSSFGIIADVSIIILFSLKSVMVCVSGSQLHCWIDAAHC